MVDRRIAVTGAGGCVGGRLTHRLVLGEQDTVVPLVHRLSGAGAMRLARLPVDIHQGSVTDRATMDDLVTDCDAVVHCAVGSREATVEGTSTTLAAAEAAGVDTFVYLCSASIYGHDLEGVITEGTPIDPDTEYGAWKAEAAAIVADYQCAGALQPTSLRPFIVYGPFSEFIRAPVADLKAGAILADGGYGPVNQIYVDNLIDGILRVLDTPTARGEVYHAVDDDPVTWRRYMETLGTYLAAHPPIETYSSTDIRIRATMAYAAANVVPPIRAVKAVATAPAVRQSVATEFRQTPWAMGAFAALPPSIQRAIQGVFSRNGTDRYPKARVDATVGPRSWPSKRYRDMHRSTGRLSNEKLKRDLGWEQRVTFDAAMDDIGAWLAYQHDC